MAEAVPTYGVEQGVHRFTFPDGSRLEVHQPHRDQVGRLWAEVTARVGAQVLNRARLDLLDLQARERFHRAAVTFQEGLDWQARLLFALEHVARSLEAAPEAAEAPVPPPAETVEPFPVEALPTPLARLVEETARALPCPPDFPGVLMLPLLGVAIGTSRVLEVKPNWREGPRIYAAVVAEPGSKKSPALDLVLTPYRRRQHQLHRTYLAEKTAYQQRLEQYGRELTDWQQRRAEGRGSRGGRPHAPQEPALPQVFTTDATLEALAALLEQNPRGIAFIQDELTGWVLAMNQYKGGKGADRQGWLSFWNGAAVLVNRKTRKEAIVLDNPFVGVAGCLPPDMLELLSDEQGREDGFVHRLLCAFPDPLVLRWTEAVVSDATLEAYGRVFEGLWALTGAADQRPHVISFTPAGRQIFIEVANALYAELADPDFPDALRGPFAKLEGYGARLALILQCCRLVCGEATSEAVDEVSGLAAAALVHYFQSHARRVYARLQATPEEQHVAKALDWLRRHQGTATVREFVTAKVAGVRDAPGAEALFSALEARGYARVEETHPSRGGRPTTRVHLLR